MMSTLDLPQHVYVCQRYGADMGACLAAGPCECVPQPSIEPTLTYADYLDYMDARTQRPYDATTSVSVDDVWDFLEAHTGVEATNREALDNAVRAVASRRKEAR